MMSIHSIRFPNESEQYRNSRDELLSAEMNLRKQIEATTALRRSLPLGGKLKEDYTFDKFTKENDLTKTKFSELFRPGKNTLVVYSFMFDPTWEKGCPSCTSILDGLDGTVPHIEARVNLAVVAKAPIDKIKKYAAERGWKKLPLLSSANNSYNHDYHGEDEKGNQIPVLNVYQKTDQGIFHFYATELFFVPPEKGQGPRHVDSIWPVWSVLDLAPEGRGEKWEPRHSYK
jgi:predicted dithiol-disulfide oxidoreductase (DUF899 family)